jgi:hypothetical protein
MGNFQISKMILEVIFFAIKNNTNTGRPRIWYLVELERFEISLNQKSSLPLDFRFVVTKIYFKKLLPYFFSKLKLK